MKQTATVMPYRASPQMQREKKSVYGICCCRMFILVYGVIYTHDAHKTFVIPFYLRYTCTKLIYGHNDTLSRCILMLATAFFKNRP